MASFTSTIRQIPSSSFTSLRPPRPSKPSTATILRPPTAGIPPQTQIQSGPVRYTGPTPTASLPTGPQNPGQKPGTSATTQGSPAASGSPSLPPPPLDATALNNIATNQFKVNNSINGLNSQSSADTIALQQALAQLGYQQPRDQLGLEQGANRRGALYSSAYNQDLGNLNHAYLTKQTAATTSNDQAQSKIASQIQALLGGVPLYNQGQYNDSVTRAIQAALANPATGQDPAVTPPAPPAPVYSRTSPPPVEQQLTTHPRLPANTPNRPHVTDPFAAKPPKRVPSTRPRITDPFAKKRKK